MSKTINITLSEAEFRYLHLCFQLGQLTISHVEEPTRESMLFQMNVHQKLDKAAYEAKLEGSGVQKGLYYYGKDLEDKMLELMEEFKEYILSGEDEEENRRIEEELKKMGMLGNKKK